MYRSRKDACNTFQQFPLSYLSPFFLFLSDRYIKLQRQTFSLIRRVRFPMLHIDTSKNVLYIDCVAVR